MSTPITAYTLYQTSNFTVAAGVHTIEFLGMSPASGQSTAFIDSVTLATVENTFSDGSFESPVLPARRATDRAQPVPPGSSPGMAGVSTNLSAFTNGSAYAPAGDQAAFIKNNASISQSVYFDAGTYNISFLATQRIGYQTQDQKSRCWSTAHASRLDHAHAFQRAPTHGLRLLHVHALPDVEFHGRRRQLHGRFLGMTSGDSTAFIDDVAIYAGCAISDGSFEEPALAAQGLPDRAHRHPLAVLRAAGVSTNGSAFTVGNPNAPGGDQVAFIKDTGSMSQSVYLAAGFYNISFLAAQRENFQTQYQSIDDPASTATWWAPATPQRHRATACTRRRTSPSPRGSTPSSSWA